MIEKKKSVGVILLCRTEEGWVAILQVRSEQNPEKENAPESYPGGCQVTVHGGLKGEENFLQALLREIREELGEEGTLVILALFDMKEGQLTRLVDDDRPEKQSVTYGGIVKEYVLDTLVAKEKGPTFGGFKVIYRHEVDQIVDLRTFDKTTGVTDEDVIAMFSDEKEAVRLAFEKLGCEKKPEKQEKPA